MRLLLDTHAFLWFVLGDSKLPNLARTLIENPENQVYLSLASVWEMTIKHSLGKFPLDRPIEQFILRETSRNDISLFGVQTQHIFGLLDLPQTHRDPFDRIIAAQSKVEGFVLLSADEAFNRLGVLRQWS